MVNAHNFLISMHRKSIVIETIDSTNKMLSELFDPHLVSNAKFKNGLQEQIATIRMLNWLIPSKQESMQENR